MTHERTVVVLVLALATSVAAAQEPAPTPVERDFTSFYVAVSELDATRSRARLPSASQVNDYDRRSGATPLTWLAGMVRPPSADTTRLAILDLLLARGARADVADPGETFPLHAASQATWAAGIERLLAHGAAPDQRIANGWTALHLVCSRAGEEWPERQAARARIATMLLDAGADPAATWTANDGQTISVVQQCTTYRMPDVIALAQARIDARAAVAAPSSAAPTSVGAPAVIPDAPSVSPEPRGERPRRRGARRAR